MSTPEVLIHHDAEVAASQVRLQLQRAERAGTVQVEIAVMDVERYVQVNHDNLSREEIERLRQDGGR